jgi:hypothetical protein
MSHPGMRHKNTYKFFVGNSHVHVWVIIKEVLIKLKAKIRI